MKQIKTVDAVGHVLCHDLTKIVKGVSKDAEFRKGHIVTAEDIPVLLSMGKENLYVWEAEEGMLHENDAAEILYQICAGEHMHPSEVKEGKIDVIADCSGLLLVDKERLLAVNSLDQVMIATRHGGFTVKEGDKLAGTRVIPLVIPAEKMAQAKAIGGDIPLLKLLPFQSKKVAVLTTGNEVYQGLIQDTFTAVVVDKVNEFDAVVIETRTFPDAPDAITAGIKAAIQNGAEMVVCTGGMSVDPDDRTPLAIKNSGADIVSYGAPVLPGAMFLLAYYEGGIPVLGLPGCVMYSRRTIFDLILPRLMANVIITAEDLAVLGHGGLCLGCEPCTYPNCGFGKG